MVKQRKPHEDGDDILAIDKHSLDEAWVNQSQLYNWYAVKCADARQVMDEAKARLEVIKAELSISIRRDPAAYGVDKAPEKAVEALILLQPSHGEALKEVHSTRHDYECLQGLLTALDHKKKALEKLVELHGRDYFSEPRAVGETNERMEEVKRDKIASRGVRPREDRCKKRPRKLRPDAS